MKSTSVLQEDHKHILRVLNVLEEVAARAERGQKVNEEDVRVILEFLEGFADGYHQGREESVLFPALLQRPDQKHYPELCALIFEHNRERSLVEGLQDSMLTKKTKDFVYYAGRLVGILRTHIQKEEDNLFPLVDSTLSPSDDERVVQDLKTFDQAWQDRKLSGILLRLNKLELKYLPRKTLERQMPQATE